MADVYLDGKGFPKQFKLIKKIGAGGFGEVYEVEDANSKTTVAVKIFRPSFNLTDEDAVQAWKQEAQQSLLVVGQNVVKYLGFNQTKASDGSEQYFLVMELADSNLDTLLADLKAKGGFISEDELVAMFEQILNGIKSVHDILIHRDLKPENVLIVKDTFKISDFGLAKYVDESTRTKSFKGWGTIKYMAPESWDLSHISKATDIYSLGVMFYQMATFELPYSSAQEKEMEELHKFGSIPSPRSINTSLSNRVDGIIYKMMQKSPKDRYQDTDEVLADLNMGQPADSTDTASIVEVAKELIKRGEEEKTKKMKQEEIYNKKSKIVELKIEEFVKKIEQIIAGINVEVPEQKLWLSKGSSTSYTLIWNGKDLITFSFDANIFTSNFKIHGLSVMSLCTAQNRQGRSDEGTNFILVQNDDDEYGTWKVLEINASVFVRKAQYPRLATMPTLQRIAQLGNAMDVITHEVTDNVDRTIKDIIESALKSLNRPVGSPQEPSDPLDLDGDDWGGGFGY